jgi:hypothetical protein
MKYEDATGTTGSGECFSYTTTETTGLTKREYFAAMAMQGLLANHNDATMEDIIGVSIDYADLLIEKLEKNENTD